MITTRGVSSQKERNLHAHGSPAFRQGLHSKMLAVLLMALAFLLAACGSQTGTTPSNSGNTPGAGTTSTPGVADTATPASQPGMLAISEFALPTADSQPVGITAGPDGNLWFTEAICPNHGTCTKGVIGSITPGGQVSEFPLPKTGRLPGFITAGPDGNLWFTEDGAVGRITPSGQITEFSISPANSEPNGIVTGPDGNLWFTDLATNKIGRITPAGQVTQFALPGSPAWQITAGPDGNLWFSETACAPATGSCFPGKIGRITPAGQIAEFPIPTTGGESVGIAAGPDGNLWFTECIFPQTRFTCRDSRIGRITPAGQITEFTPTTPEGFPKGITAGPDGNLWFTVAAVNMIGRVTPSGEISEFPTPTPQSLPNGITTGPGGTLWFVEQQVSKIGQFKP